MANMKYDGPEKVPDKNPAPVVDLATSQYISLIQKKRKRPEGMPGKKADELVRVQEAAAAVVNIPLGEFQPDESQRQFAQILVSSPNRQSYRSIAKKIGVHEKQIYYWMEKPEFRAWIASVRQQVFFYFKPLVDRELIKMAMKGSFRHMELFYNLTGDLERTVEDERLFKGTADSMTTHEEFLEFHKRMITIRGNLNGKPEAEERKAEVVKADGPGPD